MARKPMNIKRMLLLVALLLVTALVRNYLPAASDNGDAVHSTVPSGQTVEQAAGRQQSGVMVDATGKVKKTLSDDNEGSRHQRFILELASGHTVLVAHNIDLAPRVPLQNGDRVSIHGQYEWNDRGGVLHWTHHDPANRHEGGWIEYQGKRYQ